MNRCAFSKCGAPRRMATQSGLIVRQSLGKVKAKEKTAEYYQEVLETTEITQKSGT